jgi:16S rRNA G527 N7-methylase RsmG
MTDDAPLIAALATIQQRGAIGERSLLAAVEHADRFVRLIPEDCRQLIDLGSGGGLPALVIAWRRPDLAVTMVERRAARSDLLRRAVSALELAGNVTVLTCDVNGLGAASLQPFDAVTARSFASPAVVVQAADRVLSADGTLLVSEAPTDRTAVWTAALAGLAWCDHGVDQGIRRLTRVLPAARGFT